MRSIIIFVLLITSLPVCGLEHLVNWSQLSYQAYLSGADRDIDVVTGATPDKDYSVDTGPKSGLRWQHESTVQFNSRISLEINNDLFYSEKSHEPRNSFQYNQAGINFYYHDVYSSLKIGYSNRYYNEKLTKLLSIPGIQETIQQQMAHNTTLQYHLYLSRFKLGFYASLRNLEYVRFFPGEDEKGDFSDYSGREEEYDWTREWDSDLVSRLEMEFYLHQNWILHLHGFYKNDLNRSKFYDQSQYTLGLAYYRRFNFFNILKANISYQQQHSDALGKGKVHTIITDIRYTRRIGAFLAGFLSFTNHSCYDDQGKKFCYLVNMLRMQFKYSYRTERIQDSYILIGGKINPENNGNLVMIETSNHIWHELYLTAGVKYAPELYKQATGILEFYLTPDISFWIAEDFTDFKLFSPQHILSAGTTVIF